jgi:transposase
VHHLKIMRPTQILNPTVNLYAIQEALQKSPMHVHTRLLAIQLILTGRSHKETCAIFKIGRNTLTRWIQIVNVHGLNGLLPRKKVGRPHIFSKHQRVECVAALRHSPMLFGYKDEKWSGKIFLKYLRTHHRKDVSVSTAYKLYQEISDHIARQDKLLQTLDDALVIFIKNHRIKIVQQVLT